MMRKSSTLLALLVATTLLLSSTPRGFNFGGVGLGASAPQVDKVEVRTKVVAGMQRFIFDTKDRDQIYLNMPGHAAAGQTVSGTVFVEVTGKTDAKRAARLLQLKELTIEIAGLTIPVVGGTFVLSIPASTSSRTLPITLRDRKGKELARADFAVAPQPLPPVTSVKLPAYSSGTGGSFLEIACPCDGVISAGDYVKAAGHDLLVLTEMPTGIVALNSTDLRGSQEIEVSERGQVSKGRTSLLGIKLSAQNLHLKQGDKTMLTVEVVGLGPDEVPLRLDNMTPNVVTMEPSNTESLIIKPSDVQPGGRYTIQHMLTGIQVGDFYIEGTVVKRDEPAPAAENRALSTPAVQFPIQNQLVGAPAQNYENDVILPPDAASKESKSAKTPGATGASCLAPYVPAATAPIKTVCINLNVFQKSDGSGNWQNIASDIASLNQIVQWVNDHYHSCPPTDPCPGVGAQMDTKIRFNVRNIYFYQNTALWGSSSYSQLLSAVFTAHPDARQQLNIMLTEGTYGGASGYAAPPSFTNLAYDQYVLMFKTYSSGPTAYYAASFTMTHELGHVLDLLHTYSAGGAGESCNTNSCDYLSDLFCPPTNPCPQQGGWFCDPTLANNTCTNNAMGGTGGGCYFTPLQIAKMHRALTIGSATKYLFPCGAKGCILDSGMLNAHNTFARRKTLAQTFTPTKTGYLTQITHGLQQLSGSVASYDLLVTTTDVNGLPSWAGGPYTGPSVLYKATGLTAFATQGIVNAMVAIPAGQQPMLTAGTKYALILIPGGPPTGTMYWRGNSGASVYPDGSAYELNGTMWTVPTIGPKDHGFRLDGFCL